MFIIEKLEIRMNNKNDRISPGYKQWYEFFWVFLCAQVV